MAWYSQSAEKKKKRKETNSNQEFSTLQGYSELKRRLSFPNKQKLKELITSKLAWQEMLKGLL